MTTVAEFATSNYTFTATDSVRFDIDTATGEQALVTVRSGSSTGAIIFQMVVTTTAIYGPFNPGDYLTVYAKRGAVDYTIVNQEATHPLSDAETATIQTRLSGEVWLTDPAFGYVSGGYADSAMSLALASGHKVIRIPEGEFRFSAVSPILITSDITIIGAGMNASVFKFEDNGSALGRLFGDSSGAEHNIHVEGIRFESTWGDSGDYSNRSQLVYIQSSGVVRFHRCKFYKSRFMCLIIEGARLAVTTECEFSQSKRDGCRHISCTESIIASNSFYRICDDAIAVHSNDSIGTLVDNRSVITGNVLVDSQGIACLGAKRQVINGNVIVRAKTRAIMAGSNSADGVEGGTAGLDITISNNVVDTVFDQYALAGVGGGTSYYIQICGHVLTSTGSGYVGQPDGSGGIISPFAYFYPNNTDAAVSPGNWNIRVTNNTCMRSYVPGAAYSAYGLGQFWSQNGPSDPTITAASIGLTSTRAQITVDNAANGLLISGNSLWGGQVGVFLNGSAAASYLSWRNIKISNNQIANFASKGAYVVGKGVVEFIGNTFDGDPLHTHADRTANGKWGAGYANCSAIHLDTVKATIRGETWRNVGSVFSGATPTDHTWSGNIAACNPSTLGYAAGNIGIGQVTRPGSYGHTYMIEDGDPASSTYGQIISSPLLASSAMPTTGTYVIGSFVENQVPTVSGSAGSQYIVRGWVRRTTGNAHVSGTDWSEARTLTGT